MEETATAGDSLMKNLREGMGGWYEKVGIGGWTEGDGAKGVAWKGGGTVGRCSLSRIRVRRRRTRVQE